MADIIISLKNPNPEFTRLSLPSNFFEYQYIAYNSDYDETFLVASTTPFYLGSLINDNGYEYTEILTSSNFMAISYYYNNEWDYTEFVIQEAFPSLYFSILESKGSIYTDSSLSTVFFAETTADGIWDDYPIISGFDVGSYSYQISFYDNDINQNAFLISDNYFESDGNTINSSGWTHYFFRNNGEWEIDLSFTNPFDYTKMENIQLNFPIFVSSNYPEVFLTNMILHPFTNLPENLLNFSYQFIANDYLSISESPFYMESDFAISTTPIYMFTKIGSEWIFYSNTTSVYAGGASIVQSICDIYTDSSLTTIFFEQNITGDWTGIYPPTSSARNFADFSYQILAIDTSKYKLTFVSDNPFYISGGYLSSSSDFHYYIDYGSAYYLNGASLNDFDISNTFNLLPNSPIYDDDTLTGIYLDTFEDPGIELFAEAGAIMLSAYIYNGNIRAEPPSISSTSLFISPEISTAISEERQNPFFLLEEKNKFELSIWTHSDEFIRLLYGSEEFQGQAYDISFTEKLNSEDELYFSIPLYYYDFVSNEVIENPIWQLILGEQKIKLIRNKKDEDELIDSFVIKNYTESRDNDILTANVICKSYVLFQLNKMGLTFNVTNEDNIGIILSQTPPEGVSKNTIWIDYNNVFHFYNRSLNEDSTNPANWIVVYDLYQYGLPELPRVVPIEIMSTSAAMLVPSINVSKFNAISVPTMLAGATSPGPVVDAFIFSAIAIDSLVADTIMESPQIMTSVGSNILVPSLDSEAEVNSPDVIIT